MQNKEAQCAATPPPPLAPLSNPLAQLNSKACPVASRASPHTAHAEPALGKALTPGRPTVWLTDECGAPLPSLSLDEIILFFFATGLRCAAVRHSGSQPGLYISGRSTVTR